MCHSVVPFALSYCVVVYITGFNIAILFNPDVLKPSNKLRDINMKLSNTRQCKKYVEDRFQGNPVSATHLCSLETDDGAPCYVSLRLRARNVCIKIWTWATFYLA